MLPTPPTPQCFYNHIELAHRREDSADKYSMLLLFPLSIRDIDRYILDVLRKVNREGSYQGETKCIRTEKKHPDLLLKTHPTRLKI